MVIVPEKQRAAGFRKDKAKDEKTGRASAQKKPKKASNVCKIFIYQGKKKQLFKIHYSEH